MKHNSSFATTTTASRNRQTGGGEEMKEVKLQFNEVDYFVEFMKTFKTYVHEGQSHDVSVNGYHIYLYEGQNDGGGLMHVYILEGK